LHFKPCILNPNLFECTFNPKAAAAAKYFDDDMPDEYDALDAGRDFDGGVLLVDSRQISTTQPSRSQLSITQPISSGGEGGGRDVHTSSARGGAKDLTRKYAAIFSQVLSGFRV